MNKPPSRTSHVSIIKIFEKKELPDDDVFDHQECLTLEKTSLWIVSKELQAPKLFSDYFGTNEKSKFVAKL